MEMNLDQVQQEVKHRPTLLDAGGDDRLFLVAV